MSHLKSENHFHYFRLKPFLFLSDLTKCYRSIHTTHLSNMMRLHAYPSDISDPHSPFLVLLLLCLTYGDVMASCVLELIMKELIAPTCLTELAKDILVNLRYIDDMVGGSDNEEELLLALQDLQNALANFNFSIHLYLHLP